MVLTNLDFLPYKCPGCKEIFCGEHWKFTAHSCPKERDIIENRVVPTCPLCHEVVPVARGQDPNDIVRSVRINEVLLGICVDGQTYLERLRQTSQSFNEACLQ